MSKYLDHITFKFNFLGVIVRFNIPDRLEYYQDLFMEDCPPDTKLQVVEYLGHKSLLHRIKYAWFRIIINGPHFGPNNCWNLARGKWFYFYTSVSVHQNSNIITRYYQLQIFTYNKHWTQTYGR